MRIAITGGGTGGHVTPLKPVIEELRRADPSVEILYIAQKNDHFAKLIEENEVDSIVSISAGKYRRYPDESVISRLIDLGTHALNLRDAFYTVGAYIKSRRVLRQFNPDVVFGNGGYVSVPVGLAASSLNIPLVIHESDARPGLATRLLTSRAQRILFGVPTQTTTIGNKPVEYVGIPLRKAFTVKEKLSTEQLKQKLGFDAARPLVTISGSSLGAEAINDAVIKTIDDLLSVTQVAHITGAKHIDDVQQKIGDKEGYQPLEFANNIDAYFKASEIVINRASATIFTELAALAKATILIPAPQLSDQVENARILGEKNVVQVIDQEELSNSPDLLVNRITELLNDRAERNRLEKAIHKLAKPSAAHDLAQILLSYDGGHRSGEKE